MLSKIRKWVNSDRSDLLVLRLTDTHRISFQWEVLLKKVSISSVLSLPFPPKIPSHFLRFSNSETAVMPKLVLDPKLGLTTRKRNRRPIQIVLEPEDESK